MGQRAHADAIDARQVIKSLQSVESVWEELFPAEQARIIQLLVDRVTVSPTMIPTHSAEPPRCRNIAEIARL